MFDIEKEVPSLELCKKLKELGYPQDSGGWYWRKIFKNPNSIQYNWKLVFEQENNPVLVESDIKAPTCRELGEWLLKAYLKLPTGHPVRSKLISFCSPLKLNPNILSKDLIWLAENGYVKLTNEKGGKDEEL